MIFWSLVAREHFWGAVAGYLLAWATLAAWSPNWRNAKPRRWLPVLCLASAPAIAMLWSAHETTLTNEALLGGSHRFGDRIRLVQTPSIAPAVVSTASPQAMFIYAPGAHRVAAGIESLRSATGLGHGLFRFDYLPRVDGPSHQTPVDDELEIQLSVDGEKFSRTLLAPTPLPHPRWLRVSPNRHSAATTSEETDQVLVVQEGRLLRFDTGDAPTDCAFVSNHRLIISHRYDGIWELDLRTGSSRQVQPFAATRLAANGGRYAAALIEPAVLYVDANGTPKHHPLDAPADWITLTKTGAVVVSTRASASLVRLALDSTVPTRIEQFLGRPALAMTLSADERKLLVATTGFGQLHLSNHFVEDQILIIDATTLNVLARTRTARRTHRQGTAGAVDIGLSPNSIDDYRSVTVAFAGSSDVWLDALREPTVVHLEDTPLDTPFSAVELADRSVVVSSAASGSLGVLRNGELSTVFPLGPGADELRRSAPNAWRRRIGEQMFYEATRSGISCQSCHTHGDTDFVARNIGGNRLTPTASVRGIAGTAPYLRDASYPRLRDLNHLSATLLRGFRRRRGGRGVRIEAFVNGLTRDYRAAEDLASQRRGWRAFIKAQCPMCHTPPAFTNLSQHTQGMLFGADGQDALAADEVLDTPSLLSVALKPLLLADGRATSLREVVTDFNPHNRHGNTQALDDEELTDLIAFLESL